MGNRELITIIKKSLKLKTTSAVIRIFTYFVERELISFLQKGFEKTNNGLLPIFVKEQEINFKESRKTWKKQKRSIYC